MLARPVEDRRAQRARMRKKPNGSGGWHARRKRQVEVPCRPDPAEAVGTDEPERRVVEPRAQLGLAGTTSIARLAEPRADDDGGRHALGSALLERRQHGGCRYGHDGEVDRLADVENRSDCWQALHHRSRRVHRDEPPREATCLQIREHTAADLRGIGRSADDGDGLGLEEWKQVGPVHAARHHHVLGGEDSADGGNRPAGLPAMV